MKTTRIYTLVLTVCLLATMLAAPAAAQDEAPWSFSFTNSFTSQYLWRGFVPNSTPALQPTIAFGYKGFSASSWSSINQLPEGWGQNWIEHDTTVSYTHNLTDKVSLTGGYIWYLFPGIKDNPGRDSHEFFVGGSVSTFLKPSFTFYRDFDEGDGNYFYGSLSHSVDMGKGVALNLGTGVGVNNKSWIDHTTISDWDINVSVDIPAGKVTFSPFFLQMIGQKSTFGNHNAFGVNMTVLSLP